MRIKLNFPNYVLNTPIEISLCETLFFRRPVKNWIYSVETATLKALYFKKNLTLEGLE